MSIDSLYQLVPEISVHVCATLLSEKRYEARQERGADHLNLL